MYWRDDYGTKAYWGGIILLTIMLIVGFAGLLSSWQSKKEKKLVSSPGVTATKAVGIQELPVVVRAVYIHGEAVGEYFRQVIEVTRIHPGNNDQERYRLYQLVPFLASSAKSSIWFVGDEAVLKIDQFGLPTELRKP